MLFFKYFVILIDIIILYQYLNRRLDGVLILDASISWNCCFILFLFLTSFYNDINLFVNGKMN